MPRTHIFLLDLLFFCLGETSAMSKTVSKASSSLPPSMPSIETHWCTGFSNWRRTHGVMLYRLYRSKVMYATRKHCERTSALQRNATTRNRNATQRNATQRNATQRSRLRSIVNLAYDVATQHDATLLRNIVNRCVK